RALEARRPGRWRRCPQRPHPQRDPGRGEGPAAGRGDRQRRRRARRRGHRRRFRGRRRAGRRVGRLGEGGGGARAGGEAQPGAGRRLAAQSPKTASSTQRTIEITRAPRNVAQKNPVEVSPRSRRSGADSHTTSCRTRALITRRNSPRVSRISGKLKKLSTGLTIELATATRTATATNAQALPSKSRPGTNRTATQTPAAVAASWSNRFKKPHLLRGPVAR